MLEALSPRIRVLIALPFAVALIVGCGSSDDTGSATTAASSVDAFPAAGKTFQQLTQDAS